MKKRSTEDPDPVHIKDGSDSTEGGSEWRGRLEDCCSMITTPEMTHLVLQLSPQIDQHHHDLFFFRPAHERLGRGSSL